MLNKIYIRDKRSPSPKSESVSKVMSSNRHKNSIPELFLRKGLWKLGLKGYRLHYKLIPGRPDITFVSKKIAIFVNGCFWHRCPYCNYSLPKSNTIFWGNKFDKNIKRDKEKIEQLKKMNWNVIVIWECQIKKDIENCLKEIVNLTSHININKLGS